MKKHLSLRPAVLFFAALLALAGLGFVRPAGADPLPLGRGGAYATPVILKDLDVRERLGEKLPFDAQFVDTDGQSVSLGQYFDGKRPVALVFAYHTCPMLCSLVLDGVVNAAVEMPWTAGKEFEVVSISIDPRDTPETAGKKRDEILAKYAKRAGGTDGAGWHFLVGDEANIKRVADAAGFEFRWDERQKQYAHPAAMFIATPEGKLARYLYDLKTTDEGITTFDPTDVRIGLLEASRGKTMSLGEKVLLFCYQYDAKTGKYTLVAMNVMRLGGGITAVLLGGLVVTLFLRERRKRRDAAKPEGLSKPDASSS